MLENTYTGSGSFSFGTNVDFTAGTFDTFVAAGDLDGDGKPEIIAATTTANTVAILRNVIAIPSPAITSLSVTEAGSGNSITINGTNFTGISSVKFGGTAAASFNVVSSTRIDATVGGGASGNVTVTNASGTSTVAGFKFIPAITAGGATSICNGASVTLTSTAAANNQWLKDGAAVNGATGATFQATVSGNYTVQTTSNGITTASPTAIAVAVTVAPPPVITINANNQLVSNAATGNQWYLNSVIIAGATAQTYQPTQSGNYTVKSTVNGCTSDFSPTYNYIVTGIINLGNDQYIKIYPNPVKEKLYIAWNINGSPLLNIEVNDLHGKQVLVNKNISTGSAINLSLFAQGVYFIKIHNNKLKINETVKIVKQN